MNRFLLVFLVLFCAVASITACSNGDDTDGQPPQSAGVTRHTFLNAQQVVSSTPPVSFATGTAAVALDTATSRLSGTVTLSNTTNAVTAVHINDSDAGSNGDPVVSLVETPVGSGTWVIPDTAAALTAAQSDRFKAAGFHVIADTSANPFGEIRGQLLSYGDNIQPIFDQHCTACHTGGQSAAAGLSLDGANSYASLVNQPARQSSGTRVIPFDAASSVLFRRISGIGFTGSSRMPPNGLQLSLHDIALIEVWINMGAMDDNGVLSSLPVFQGTQLTLRAFLNDKQTVSAPPVISAATGSAVATLDAVTGRLTGTVTLFNVTNAVTAVHINDGDAGSAGALVVSLNETPTGSGSWTLPATTLTAAQMDRFKIAGFYVSVDTSANPAGEIRGQLLSYAVNIQQIFQTNCLYCHNDSGPAAFTGLNLSPAGSYAGLVNRAATQSTGSRVVPFDADNSVLYQRLTKTGFSAVVGPVMPPFGSIRPVPFPRDLNLIKAWINMGAMDDTGAVRSPQTPASRTYTRNAFLNAIQVVPATSVTSTATGTVVLDTATSKLTGTVVISNMTATAVHINDGDAENNGALVVSLAETSPGSGIWTVPADAPALSDLQMNRFIAAGLYISADTNLNPNGEIRGQLQNYAANVQPLFSARCVVCHDVGATAGSTGLLLGPNDSYARLVNEPTTQITGTQGIRVIPFDAVNSVLYKRITGIPPTLGLQMPDDGTPFLTPREENIIKTWINMGAQND